MYFNPLTRILFFIHLAEKKKKKGTVVPNFYYSQEIEMLNFLHIYSSNYSGSLSHSQI